MSAPQNVIMGSLLGRSVLFGIILGVAVFVVGGHFDLWQAQSGNYVMLMIIAGSIALLPAYEKLANLRPASGP